VSYLWDAGSARTCYLVHDSERPHTSFAVLDSGSCLMADSLFDMILMKLDKVFYSCRTNLRVECKVGRYTLGDFVLRIGTVTMSQTGGFLGILFEVGPRCGSCWRFGCAWPTVNVVPTYVFG